ncbi:hypothetical protein L0156_22910, partial [bacterium]|nr:hypothetical protein [bacterium]
PNHFYINVCESELFRSKILISKAAAAATWGVAIEHSGWFYCRLDHDRYSGWVPPLPKGKFSVKKIALVPLLFVVLLSACGNSVQWPPKPAGVHLGEDSCAACKMIISQENYGAQLHQR